MTSIVLQAPAWSCIPPSSSFPQATADCRHPTRCIFPKNVKVKVVTDTSTKPAILRTKRLCQVQCLCSEKEEEQELELNHNNSDTEPSLGVSIALVMLNFYRREISPFLPGSCRFVPSCSEYSMQAYRKYGVVKGTILTAWRLLRCNPLGPSGFDPPRWFGETRPPQV